MANYLPPDIVTGLRLKYRDSSIATIAGGIKRVITNISPRGQTAFNPLLLQESVAILAFLDGLDKTSVRKALLNNVMAVAALLPDFPEAVLEQYRERFERYAKEHNEQYKYQPISSTATVETAFIPNLEMIRKTADERLAKARQTGARRDWVNAVILALYSGMPALRGQEFYATRVVEHSPGTDLTAVLPEATYPNFLDLASGTLVVRDYKTQQRYNIRYLRIPPPLLGLLKEYHEAVGEVGFLIPDEQGRPLEHSPFTKRLHSLLGAEISTDMLRKIYIAEMLHYLQHNKLSPVAVVAIRKQMATAMGHSLEAQEFVYSGLRLTPEYQYSSPVFMKALVEYYG